MTYKDQNIRDLFSHTFLWRLLLCAAVLCCPCSTFNTAHAQPTIKGNVYGGGQKGDTGGNTTVTVCAVDLDGSVFGGAAMADVGGRAFVHIDGENMSDDILINKIYGGNDIAGTIGASINETSSTIPDELKVTARTEDGEVMAVAHREYHIFGVQFHPESILTPDGRQMLRNFLSLRK